MRSPLFRFNGRRPGRAGSKSGKAELRRTFWRRLRRYPVHPNRGRRKPSLPERLRHHPGQDEGRTAGQRRRLCEAGTGSHRALREKQRRLPAFPAAYYPGDDGAEGRRVCFAKDPRRIAGLHRHHRPHVRQRGGRDPAQRHFRLQPRPPFHPGAAR